MITPTRLKHSALIIQGLFVNYRSCKPVIFQISNKNLCLRKCFEILHVFLLTIIDYSCIVLIISAIWMDWANYQNLPSRFWTKNKARVRIFCSICLVNSGKWPNPFRSAIINTTYEQSIRAYLMMMKKKRKTLNMFLDCMSSKYDDK